MNKKLLISTLLLSVALTSCNSTPASSTSSSSSLNSSTISAVSSTATSTSSTMTSSSTSVISSTSSNSSTSSTNSSYVPNLTGSELSWPKEDLENLGIYVPEFVADSYDFYDFTIIGLGITLYCYKGDLEATAILEYGQLLVEAGYVFVQTSGDVDVYLSADGTTSVGVAYYSDTNSLGLSFAVSSTAEAWPSEKINSYYEMEINLPAVPGVEEYYWEDATYYSNASISFVSETDVLQTYITTLANAGWSYSYVESDTSSGYEAGDYYLFTKDDFAGVGIVYYYDSENDSYVIELSSFDVPVAWPTELIKSYFGDVNVPSFPGVDEYLVDDSDFDSYGLVIEIPNVDESTVDTYKQTLEAAGYTTRYDSEYESDMAVDPDKIVDIMFYYYEGYLEIQIFDYEEVEIAENEVSFIDESLITEKSDESVTWVNGSYSVTITKGESAQNVGNGSYLSNPIRLYKGQHVVLSWGEDATVSSITITASSQSNKADITTISNVVGGTITYGSEQATIEVAEGAASVEFDIAQTGDFKQCHLSSIAFNA